MCRVVARNVPRLAIVVLLSWSMPATRVNGQQPPPAPVTSPIPTPGYATPPQPPVDPDSIVTNIFTFTIDPRAPAEQLLPIPPKAMLGPVRVVTDLAQVPEIFFQDPAALGDAGPYNETNSRETVNDADMKKAQKKYALDGNNPFELVEKAQSFANIRGVAKARIAHQIAKINYLNQQRRDGFLETLLKNRADLAGLPFMMGDACRLKEQERLPFSLGVSMVNDALAQKNPDEFWKKFDEFRSGVKDGLASPQAPKVPVEVDEKVLLRLLMQIMPRESAELRRTLVGRLATFKMNDDDRNEATRALAKLSVFSMDASERRAAADMLLKRPTGPATEVLKQGLRYPYPAIAENAAAAIVRQQRDDLIPELIGMLEAPDPRQASVKEIDGKQTLVMPELVRINHLRNCLLCHAPGNITNSTKSFTTALTSPGGPTRPQTVSLSRTVVAAVPPPGHEMPTGPSQAYYAPQDEAVVRSDVTYLRQDFSLMMKVDNAAPWPEMQRFDFIVRSRVVSEAEAGYLRTELARGGNPYHRAALAALRQLTGRDAGTTAQQWRDALGDRAVTQ